MKIIYFDCFSGISGDMILGALLDLGLDIRYLEKELRKLKLKGYKIRKRLVVKKGILASKFDLIEKKSDNKKKISNKYRNLSDILKIINDSRLENETKSKIKKILINLGKAEAKVHKTSLNKVHFHEVGALDTIIDISGAVIGLKKLEVKKIYSSKINVGSGFVKFSHGLYPVPAPATSELLKNIPVYNNKIKFELATPTGAAIISTLCSNFGNLPAMEVYGIGHGAGDKDLAQPNILRAFYGKLEESKNNFISVLETNIDNMNPEIFPYVIERLMDNGALDAYTTQINMKKNRHGIKITALSKNIDAGKLANILFAETTTLGIRIFPASRQILDREIKTLRTKYGKVRVKISKLIGKVKNISPEYEDCVKIAKNKKIPLKKVYKEALKLG